MGDYIVDTNVWVIASQIVNVGKATDVAELECIQNCIKWLRTFANSQDRLIVDNKRGARDGILWEYRNNIVAGGEVEQLLRQLQTLPRDRLIEQEIEWIDHGYVSYAKVPESLEAVDPSDRKFVAVALAHDPRPPIISATDRGWTKAQEVLEAAQIVIEKLCEEFMRDKLERRGL